MKAFVYSGYGSPDVLRYEELAEPVPGDDEVLLRVRAASVNPLDWRMMHGGPYLMRQMFGLYRRVTRQPGNKQPGVDVAGRVEAVGRNVTQLKPGDEVFGVCRGAFAEYARAPASKLVRKPLSMTFEQAAALPVAAVTALQGLRDKGLIQPGQKVLINGAAGGVGTFAVQLAKSFGAEVTGVCSAGNAELVRSIGADRVIDYALEDFTGSTERYDLIFDCVGNHTLSDYRRVLKPLGRYVCIGGKNIWTALARALYAPLLSRLVSQHFVAFIASIKTEDLQTLSELMEAGKMSPVIDRLYRLSQVPDAMRYLGQWHARGKVIITVEENK
ncbi:MAG: NAD(P)-dependent alcohol dehydrogenase [Acidobacteria bacterium]|nr:NAD(P)-dependent alcohol dehydrogenase [Acidobacteriota bacterium]